MTVLLGAKIHYVGLLWVIAVGYLNDVSTVQFKRAPEPQASLRPPYMPSEYQHRTYITICYHVAIDQIG